MANNAETDGRRPALLMTRPEEAAARFVSGLDPRCVDRVQIVYSPLLEIVPTQAHVSLVGYDSVIFTSAVAVPLIASGAGRCADCVGARTAEAARTAGWQVRIVAEDAEDLISQIAKLSSGQRFLHVAGAHRRGEIAKTLTALGHHTEVVVAYDQRLSALNDDAHRALGGKNPVLVPLFSPRTAAQFANDAAALRHVDVIAMSAAVAQEVSELPLDSLHIVVAPTARAMRDEVERMLRGDSLA